MADKTWAAFGVFPGRDDEHNVQPSIERALSYLSERDQIVFRKKLKEQSEDEHQVMHTFRELLVGVFLAQQGYTPCYEPRLDGLTPDWQFQHDGRNECIADVVNFHIEQKIEAQIDSAFDEHRSWAGEIPDQTQRLHFSLWQKAGKYKNLVSQKNVPYVVFVFGWMQAVVQPEQIDQCLLSSDGLFNEYPSLSGVYHMRERPYKISAELVRTGNKFVIVPTEKTPFFVDNDAGYCFDFYANPKASHSASWLTSGFLPYRFLG